MDIFELKPREAEALGERLAGLRTERGLSQEQLAGELNRKYGTKYTQGTISKIENVGRPWNKCKVAPFPKAEKLLLLADYFGVDVGFLIGETDYETFNEERTSKYLRLNSRTVKTLERMTSPHGSFRFSLMTGPEVSGVLEQIIPAESFGPLIKAFADLKRACEVDDHSEDEWTDLRDKYGEDVLDEAFDRLDSLGPAEDPPSSEEVCMALGDINQIIDKGYGRELASESAADVARFRLQLAFDDLLNELFPRQRPKAPTLLRVP